MSEHISQHAKYLDILDKDGILIFPTDTAFGIGCRIDRPKAISRLYELRRRPITQAFPVLVSSKEQALQYFNHPSDMTKAYMDRYWPGALTIVDRVNTSQCDPLVTAGKDTIGLRMPRHEMLCSLISDVGVPIIGTSANFHGEKTPYFLHEVNTDLISLIEGVVPGVCQEIGHVSTVVDCSVNPPHIIRQGAIRL